MTIDISHWIDRNAAFNPRKPAIIHGGAELSYLDFAKRIDKTARFFVNELKLQRGDRVAYLGLNTPEQLVLTFAAARAGLIMVAMNWRLAVPERAEIMQDSLPGALIVAEAFAEQIEDIMPVGAFCPVLGLDSSASQVTRFSEAIDAAGGPPVAEGALSDPLLLVYTSGTTGRAKGTVLNQEAVTWNAANAIHMHDMTSADRIQTFLPMFHVGGLNIQTIPAFHCGASVILHDRFEADAVLDAVARKRPTITLHVPATMQAVLSHPNWAKTDMSSLRVVATGSTDVPIPLIEAFQERGTPVIQVYGSTETAPVAIYQRVGDRGDEVGAIGHPGLHTDIKIIDEDGQVQQPGEPGQILVRGPHVASGYWNDAEMTASTFRNGWFHSGDVAVADDNGLFWFKDRIKNVVISGGENIYPAELERVLVAIDGVVEAAVVGVPDPDWGAVPVAVVVAETGRATPRSILNEFSGRLAKYKHPKEVVLVDRLPRNVMGKVILGDVRKIAIQRRRESDQGMDI